MTRKLPPIQPGEILREERCSGNYGALRLFAVVPDAELPTISARLVSSVLRTETD